MEWLLVLIINGHMRLIPVSTEQVCEESIVFVKRELLRKRIYRHRPSGEYLQYACSPGEET